MLLSLMQEVELVGVNRFIHHAWVAITADAPEG